MSQEYIFEVNYAGKILFVTPPMAGLYGYTSYELVNEPISNLLHPGQRKRFSRYFRRFLDNCIKYGSEDNFDAKIPFFGIHKSGKPIPIQISLVHYENHMQFVFARSDSPGVALPTGSAVPWTSKSTEPEVVVQVDSDFTISFANDAAKIKFGQADLVGRSFQALFPYRIYLRYQDLFKKYLFVDEEHREAANLRERIHVICQTAAGDLFPAEISFGNALAEEGGITLTCVLKDISDTKSISGYLADVVYHDRITGLGNENLLYNTLGAAIYPGDRSGAVLQVSLQGVRRLEDVFGISSDQTIIRQAARRITRLLTELEGEAFGEVTVFRVNRDEFTVVIPSAVDVEALVQGVGNLITVLESPYTVKGVEHLKSVHVKINIGVSIFIGARDPLAVVQEASIALEHAVADGPGSYRFYTPELGDQIQERLVLEEKMQDALEKDQFRVYYQPLVGGDGNLVGLEALLRWESAKGTIEPPRNFLTVVEQNDVLMKQIGEWVLRTAVAQVHQWNTEYGLDLGLSVNLSARQVDEEIIDACASILKTHPIGKGRLRLEITESALMKNPETASGIFTRLKDELDVLLAIDDFGTGLSSLAYFAKFPVDTVKLDMGFVEHLGEQRTLHVVEAILHLAENAGIHVVAEGITNPEEYAVLKELGCNSFQGFFFGEPLDVRSFEQFFLYREMASETSF